MGLKVNSYYSKHEMMSIFYLVMQGSITLISDFIHIWIVEFSDMHKSAIKKKEI